jgi:hypothetical protein
MANTRPSRHDELYAPGGTASSDESTRRVEVGEVQSCSRSSVATCRSGDDVIAAPHQNSGMVPVKDDTPRKKRIWMVTPDAPLGEYVDPDSVLPGELELADRRDVERAVCSFASNGASGISEADEATVPAEFLEALFGKSSK